MSFIGDQELIGHILSIAALTVAPFATFFGRHYSRSLYFAQFLYVVSLLFLPGTNMPFSSYLGYSWLTFMPTFTTNYCTAGDYSCTYGNLVSPALVWLGGAVFFFILIKIIACKKKNARFLTFYNFYKGFMYWFYGPLIFYSVTTLIPLIDGGNYQQSIDFRAACVVIILFVVISVVEVIAYKIAQKPEENAGRKWIEFCSHYMVAGTMTLCAVYSAKTSSRDTIRYLIPNLFLGIFAIVYLIAYKFSAKVLERVIQIVQDAIIIVILNIMVFKYQIILDTQLDFFALVVVMALEILVLFVKFIAYCKNKNEEESSEVAPEPESREKRINNNAFSSNDQINPEYTYDGLKNSGVSGGGSPRRGAPPRRR
jgi:hypothetical protein